MAFKKPEKPTDWKIQVTLDRKALLEDITRLTRILARQRVAVTVSASSREEAEEKAKEHLMQHIEVPWCYVKALNPRRLPT